MQTFFVTWAGLLLAFGAMALGVSLGRAPLARGCGRLEDGACGACKQPCHRRRGASAEGGRR